MNHPARILAIAIVLAALGLGAWHWRDAWLPTGKPAATAPVASPVAGSPSSPSGPAAGASQAAVRHPIDAVAAVDPPEPAASTPAEPPTLESLLARLFGAELMAPMFQTDDFARRVVATVDNLGREKAPARLWPLQPPAGRFTAHRQGEVEIMAADNFVRYARHMSLVEKADLRRVVALYKRFYPQFQQAYEELGYPGKHFNDRVVEVIDLLLATPEPAAPVAVRVPPIQGPIQPQRPWLLYEFADPQQQALPAGSQLLLRMGPENQRRLKVRLTELRRLLARP